MHSLNLSILRENDPDDIPIPPDRTPEAPVEEPPDAPHSDPNAPVREPGPEPQRRLFHIRVSAVLICCIPELPIYAGRVNGAGDPLFSAH